MRARLIIVLDLGPGFGDRRAEPAADPDGAPVLVGHAAPAVDGRGALDSFEPDTQPVLLAADHDQHATVPAARTPEPVVVVGADRLWEALPPTQQVDSTGD